MKLNRKTLRKLILEELKLIKESRKTKTVYYQNPRYGSVKLTVEEGLLYGWNIIKTSPQLKGGSDATFEQGAIRAVRKELNSEFVSYKAPYG